MNISIEYDDDAGYGHIHRTGCRHLVDSEEIGEFFDFEEAEVGAAELTGWDNDLWYFAPCVDLL